MLGQHEEVLEVDPGLGEKGREVVKEKSESDRLVAVFRDQRLGVRALAEQGALELLLGHRDLGLEPLVAGQAADQLRDQRHVGPLAGANARAHLGRSLSRKTKRMAPWVSEKLAILLSTSPAARPASIRSVSRSGLPAPFARTTQIAPFGSIQVLSSRSRARSRRSFAPRKTRSHGVRGLPLTTSRVRPRRSFMKEGSSRSTTATFDPGLTPSLSRSGFVVSATHRSEDDHAQQPSGIRARDHKDDQGDRVADPARQQAAEAHEEAEHDRAGDAARGRTDQRRRRDPGSQTSITCRSLTAPVTVPE